jgi:hypothetical protein
MEGGMVVMGLLRVSSNISGLWTTDFDQIFGRKFGLLVPKVYEGGERPWSTAVGRLPWFVWVILTHGGELSY